jgi:hypothetical protein
LESKIGRPAAERIDAYRGRFKIEDQEQALGLEPPEALAARAARGQRAPCWASFSRAKLSTTI